MLKNKIILIAAAVFIGGAVSTEVALADDDLFDLMNPAWWADRFDDDNDDWRYRYHAPGYYAYGGPYAWGHPGYYPQPINQLKKTKPAQPRVPE